MLQFRGFPDEAHLQTPRVRIAARHDGRAMTIPPPMKSSRYSMFAKLACVKALRGFEELRRRKRPAACDLDAPRSPLRCLFVQILLLVATCTSLAAGAQSDQQRTAGRRSNDEIWLVSSRQIGHIRSRSTPRLITRRYRDKSGWTSCETAELFAAQQPDQLLVIYVHGNRVERQQAAAEGRYVYHLLTHHAEFPGSIRFVIWSWPSAQIRGPLRDVRVKAERTKVAGYCLGWFLAQLPDRQKVSLLSYSFGARIASGGLHLLGGGHLAGRTLAIDSAPEVEVHLVTLAGALNRHWLRPSSCHGLAWEHLDYLLNLFNTCDPVLKRYPLLEKQRHADAIGYAGLYTADLGALRERIEQWNVANSVERSHAAMGYFANPFLRQRIRKVLFWQNEREALELDSCP